MVLVIEKKYLEGRWWQYGLGLAALQMGLWFLLGFKLNPSFDVLFALRYSYFVYGTFILFAFLPFVYGRLQLKRLMWLSLIGFILGDAAYFLLAAFEPIRRFNLLPFIAFAQVAFGFMSLGIIVELGRYVIKKVFEE